MNYSCCNNSRRDAVKAHPYLNGIDFLEVLDNPADPFDERQTTLFVHFLKPVAAGSLEVKNIIIAGGDRVQHVKVTDVSPVSPADAPFSPPGDYSKNIIAVKVNAAGDFSTYTLKLVQDTEHLLPPAGFDPVLSAVDFSFKVLCTSDFDCKPGCDCEEEQPPVPSINYLAKDYASFRQLMLDRMALLLPSWTERHPADLGVALVELLAYTGDYLSYKQDAIATEAYLGTARRRISVRRHVRLVDYFMSDGCNARAWVQVQVGDNVFGLQLNRQNNGFTTSILSRVKTLPNDTLVLNPDSQEYQSAINAGAQVFELMQDVTLYSDHNQIEFYTWGDSECCLPKGATSATLNGSFPNLKVGQVVILKEIAGPQTGAAEDADPSHCYAVCLTSVTLSHDPLYGNVASPADPGLPVTEITWSNADALPAPLCISSRNGTNSYNNTSVVLGNIVLTDYGLTITDINTSSLIPSMVPEANPALDSLAGSCGSHCEQPVVVHTQPRFCPQLARGPLTQAAPFDAQAAVTSATACMQWALKDVIPAITLTQYDPAVHGGVTWHPYRDLLYINGDTPGFVAEVESDGSTFLRFGNDLQGMRPVAGSEFVANYRIGNGAMGNVGANSLAYLVTRDTAVLTHVQTVANPMPAQGGVEPESIEQARQNAPQAFRTQERAVTADDYASFAEKANPNIQEAVCTFRWTGSWRTAFVSVDPTPVLKVDDEFKTSLLSSLEPYRMAGMDLDVDGPVYVSLEINMTVCVTAGYFANDVKAALLNLFSNRKLSNGKTGVFFPDNFSFGQTVYLSPLYAAAQDVPGVDFVQITTFRRQDDVTSNGIPDGKLELNRLEIARLDNDPNFPDRGIFKLTMNGGK